MYVVGGKTVNRKFIIWERWDIREMHVDQISLTVDFSSDECINKKNFSDLAVTPVYVNKN
jgi:hypothetical protein